MSQNKTKVGLKEKSERWMKVAKVGQNKTKVGLKAPWRRTSTPHSRSQNKTKVGLKVNSARSLRFLSLKSE